jgi:hypothetical protein
MGLDQYAFARKEGAEDLQFSYWRKHADLQGWMENLYRQRGGEGIFNCVDLRLFKDDLKGLLEQHENLERAEGFFWGQSRKEDVEKTKEFINEALSLMENGYEIIYTSWW